MFKKYYGIIQCSTITEFPIKKYGRWTKQRTYPGDFAELIYASEQEVDRENQMKKIFTKGYWSWNRNEDPTPLPTEKPELPKDMKVFDSWDNSIFWCDTVAKVVYQDVHCILDRDIYDSISNKANRRKQPYRSEVHTFGRVEFFRYEVEGMLEEEPDDVDDDEFED